jgi:uncharacterized protein (DUF3820 family)
MEPAGNLELKMNSKIHFGKYKGQSVHHVLSSNPFYIIWTLADITWIKYDKIVIERIQSGFSLNKFFCVPFGKHESRNLAWMLKNDLGYFIWFYECLCKAYNIEIDESLSEMYQQEMINTNTTVENFDTSDLEDQLNFYN